MKTKTFNNVRWQLKGGSQTDLNKAHGFVPLDKELIAIKPDQTHNYARLAVGDGVTVASDLKIVNPQADWKQDDATAADYIKNKPDILSKKEVAEIVEQSQTQANWTQNDPQAADYIKNKPRVSFPETGSLVNTDDVEEKIKESRGTYYDVITETISGNGGGEEGVIGELIIDGINGNEWFFNNQIEITLCQDGGSSFFSNRYALTISDINKIYVSAISQADGGSSFWGYKYDDLNEKFKFYITSGDAGVYATVRGIGFKCTGATLQEVDGLPQYLQQFVYRNPINKIESPDTSKEYIYCQKGNDLSLRQVDYASTANAVVRRNSAAGINIRTLKEGATYSDSEAPSYGHVKNVMLKDYATSADMSAVKQSVADLEGALLKYSTYSAVDTVFELPENSAFQSNAIINYVGGGTAVQRSFVSPEVRYEGGYSSPGATVDGATGHVRLTWSYITHEAADSLGYTVIATLPKGSWYVSIHDLQEYYYEPGMYGEPIRGKYMDYSIDGLGLRHSDGNATVTVTAPGGDGCIQYVEFTLCIDVPADATEDEDATYSQCLFESARVSCPTAIKGLSGHTANIPLEVRQLPGYGLAVPAPYGLYEDYIVRNLVLFNSKTFSRRCAVTTLTEEDVESSRNAMYHTVTIHLPSDARVSRSVNGTFHVEGYVAMRGSHYNYLWRVGCVDDTTLRVYIPTEYTKEQAKQLFVGKKVYYRTVTQDIDISSYLTHYDDELILRIGQKITLSNNNAPVKLSLDYCKVPKGG